MKILTIAVAAALFTSAPAWAADPPATGATASTAAKPGRSAPTDKTSDKKVNPDDKLICAREEQTDSFIPKRVCRTQAQIDELRRGAQQLNDDQQLLNGRPQSPGR
jgi:hypothetical protein